jgi:hypothetical protein
MARIPFGAAMMCLAFLANAFVCCAIEATEPVALRIESLTVSPAQVPSAVVVVQNRSGESYDGRLELEAPVNWKLEPEYQPIHLAPGATQRIFFLVKRATNRPDNRYPLMARVRGSGGETRRQQQVVVASAPYFKPKIDGSVDDWKDAIPVSWTTAGKETVVRTFWNRRRFCLLVEVAEDRFAAWQDHAQTTPCDAVQLAISAEDSVTPNSLAAKANRFEYLLVGGEGGQSHCFQLAGPDTEVAATRRPQDLSQREVPDAELRVWRDSGRTYYECSLSWQPIREYIRPSEGRSFCFSILVHDPDGAGLRDWGQAAGLWTWQRNALAWSDWANASWGEEPAFDNKTSWGLCSSKY